MRPLNRFRFTATLAVIACTLGVVTLCHYEAWKHSEVHIESSRSFVVQAGSAFNDVALNLNAIGIVRNPGYFEILARLTGATGSIQAGEYSFSGSYTPVRVLQKLVAGDVVVHALKLPEGGTFKDFVVVLADTPNLEFDVEGIEVASALEQLGLETSTELTPTAHGEGWFFPDTYHYASTMSASDILRIAHEKMIQELSTLWAQRDANTPFRTPYELLILASIVEKESALVDDQARIAGVFCRRLQIGMRLQADPTVIYGLGEEFTGNLTRAHLRTDNPYNTYRISGLPPTPIAAPGRAALRATANPTIGDALYFVARGDGTSEFSTTLEDHNRAVRKFQLQREN